MKRDLSHFEDLEEFVKFSYSNFGNSLQIFSRDFHPEAPLGYCYKYSGNGVTIYTVVHSPIGKPHTDRRIVAHEYGHLTLGHLTGIHEELDGRVLWTIQNDRKNLIESLNKQLGIDYADKLLNRVIDDPQLNHSLHNIAMDFEVNQQILSTEDIEEMEEDLTEKLVYQNPEFQRLKKIHDSLDINNIDSDPNLSDEEKETMKKVKEEINKQMASSKVKLMLPERYHFQDGSPFPIDLTYPEYLILIIKHLDQFVKMLVSIKNGGSGDTSEVSEEDLKNALNGDGSDEGPGSNGGMQSLDDLLDYSGMNGNSSQSGKGGKGKGSGGSRPEERNKGTRPDPDNYSGDHANDSRDDADKKRAEGTIQSRGADGCSSTGGSCGVLDTDNEPKDPVENAIRDVIKNFKKKVYAFDLKKEKLYQYNRGINRTVIVPSYKLKPRHIKAPKIVYLIDVSGSMDTSLVNRVLHTIAGEMKKIKNGLKYDIICWSTELNDHIKDLDPRDKVPKIHIGGGTRMAKGIEYFEKKYGNEATMVLISDFDDYLDEWEKVTDKMNDFDLYAFNYGYQECTRQFKNLKVRNFNNEY